LTLNPDGDLMDFHAAAEQAIADVRASAGPDSDSVQAALQLAVHAWQNCDPNPATAIGWAMFGTGVCAAIDELGPPRQPVVILIDNPKLPDTSHVRHHTAEVVTTVAQRLEAAASDPHNTPVQRWAWATAAARLHTAGDDLVNWP
jgi:hypothetical protein